MRKRFFTFIVAAAAVLAATVSAAAVTGAIGSDPEPSAYVAVPTTPAPDGQTADGTIISGSQVGSGTRRPAGGPADARVLGALRVLRGDSQSALPSGLLRSLAINGADPSSARFAATDGRGNSLYVAATEGGRVCLMDNRGGGGCNTLTEVENGYLLHSADSIPGLRRGEVQVSGVVPDDIDEVAITLRDGSSASVKVHNNVFVTVVSGGPKEVSWSRDGSLQRIDVPWMAP